MFHSDFTEAQVIITCTRKNICNYCDQIYMPGNTLYAGGNFEQQEDLGFSGLLKKSPSIIDYMTKIELIKIKSTQFLNIDKQKLKNPVCDDIDENEDDK